MAAGRHRLANRQNAKRSTGPRSTAGKNRASLNALKHGLLSPRLSLLMDETAEELVSFHHRLFSEFAPVGALEELLVERIISQAWRLRRVLRIERDVLVAGQIEGEETGEYKLGFAYARDERVSAALENVSRYERSLEASFFRNLDELECRRLGRGTAPGNETNPIVLDVGQQPALAVQHAEEHEPLRIAANAMKMVG